MAKDSLLTCLCLTWGSRRFCFRMMESLLPATQDFLGCCGIGETARMSHAASPLFFPGFDTPPVCLYPLGQNNFHEPT